MTDRRGAGGGHGTRAPIALDDALTLALGRGGRATLDDELAVRRYAEATLRLAYPGSRPRVEPAPGRPELAIGALRVTLWPDGPEPLVVAVVVADEMARGAWRRVAAELGDAVRAALAARCPAHQSPHQQEDRQ